MEPIMKRFVIERHIPGVGSLGQARFKELSAASNAAVTQLAGKVQWVQSYVAGDHTFCVYLGESEEALREHSRLAGFPITRVNEIGSVIDPITAYGG
jgi:hypothetical protein